MDNGARLGWLIDPPSRTVLAYKHAQAPEILRDPASIDGGDILKGFTLDPGQVWSALNFGEQK